jgi:hypothetical protein
VPNELLCISPLCLELEQWKESDNLFVSSNNMYFTLQMIDFFLEMPPYNGVYFIFTVERNDGGKSP